MDQAIRSMTGGSDIVELFWIKASREEHRVGLETVALEQPVDDTSGRCQEG